MLFSGDYENYLAQIRGFRQYRRQQLEIIHIPGPYITSKEVPITFTLILRK